MRAAFDRESDWGKRVVKLRAHQSEALDAVVGGLSLPPGTPPPAGGLRGTLVSATGTGKTITAATAARRLVPRGRVAWLVPTLDLLTQTIEAWRSVGHDGPAIAVCSLGADPLLETWGVRCTTNPTRLALWAGQGPVTVFATYASLAPQGLEDEGIDTDLDADVDGSAPGVLERALHGSYGQRLDPFDLLIVDEAHRTSGDLGKAWAAVLDDERIPAARRLFMTATPRLWTVRPGAGGGEPAQASAAVGLVASMDDVGLYGPVLHELGLMEAIERGILAGFEVDVLEIRDPEAPGEDAPAEEVRGRRLAALQAALLGHLSATDARSLLSFHSRTLEAMAFARALPETAAELHGTDPAVYPARVGAEWLCGEHAAVHRREVLGRFADGLDPQGWVTDVQILASCRVLSEGVDIRGRRGVDGVVFADTRSSPVEIVQIVGRGLRQDPGEGKVARLIVPVFLRAGEDPDDMIASASYRPLVAVLQGLRAHDERIAERLILRTTTARGVASDVVVLDPEVDAGDGEGFTYGGGSGGRTGRGTVGDDAGGARGNGGGGRAGGARGVAKSEVPLLRFSLPRSPEVVAMFLRTRVLRPDSEVWLSGLNALRVWVGKHGSARVPMDAAVDVGGRSYPLGAWIGEQRRAFRAGTLKPWRAELLSELGMVWSVGDARFLTNLAAARAYFAVHGTLAAPRDAAADGVAVGQWLANCRKTGGLGGNAERAAERRQLLEAVDPDWNPDWPVDWQRGWVVLRQLLDDGATLAEILPGVRVGGEDVGRWLRTQRETWGRLGEAQRERLAGLGVSPAESKAVELERPVGVSPFDRGVAALTQYRAREGHVRVPRQHVETVRLAGADRDADGVDVRLGVWLSNVKSPARRAKLEREQLEVLAGLGLTWAG